jgi:protein-tyrosine-phosphatase
MKFSFGGKSKVKIKKTILFVCVENAGRSQMTEGFFKKYAPEGFVPSSAGTKTNLSNKSACCTSNGGDWNRHIQTKAERPL